jgi:hypothetical protein
MQDIAIIIRLLATVLYPAVLNFQNKAGDEALEIKNYKNCITATNSIMF